MKTTPKDSKLRAARGVFSLLVAAFFLVGGVALLRDTALQGQDFDVFWNTARHVLNGQPPYDLVRDGGMVYKYPPWTLPAFFPLAVFPLESARWIWAAIELASLTYVGFWLLRAGVKRVVLLTLYPLFWGIWAVHAMDGQVTLAILALVLWLQEQRTRSDALTIVKTGWALSFKVFTLFAALPLRRRFARTRVLALSVLVAGALSVPCLLATPSRQPLELLRAWSSAASSGGTEMAGGKIRGRENQGLPALLLRMTDIPPSRAGADVAAFGVLAIAFAALWIGLGVERRLSSQEALAAALGLAAALHPLAWFHLFVLAFPLAVLAVDRGWAERGRRPGILIGSGLGFFFIALATRNVIGGAGEVLESLSVKSWGILICLGVLLYDRTTSRPA